jgi:hypothetical protein
VKFIVTKELGRLAKWLRILGYDTTYFSSDNRSSLVIASLREGRIILTRDSRMGRYAGLKIVKVNSDFVKEQIGQVLNELSLKPSEEDMFCRCTICNEILEGVEKSEVKGKVPEYVFQTQEEFMRCPKCLRFYWQGTHWGNVTKTLREITGFG